MGGKRKMQIIRSKNILKGIAVLIVAAGLFISTNAKVSAAESLPEKITLNQAIEIAVENNMVIKLLDSKTKNAEANITYANKLAGVAAGKKWNEEEVYIQILKEQYLVPKQKTDIWKNLLLDKSDQEKSLKKDVSEAYFNVLLSKKNIVLNQKNIERIKQDIKIKTELLKKGLEKQDTIDSLDTNLLEAEQQLADAEQQNDLANLKFNMVIGISLDKTVELADEKIDYTEFTLDDISLVIQKYATTDINYLKAVTAKEEAQLEYDLVKKNTTKQSETLGDLSDNLLDCNNNIIKASRNVDLTIRTDYNNLLNLYDDIRINQYKYDLCKKQLESFKTRLKVGQINQNDLNSKLFEFEQLGYALERSQTNYYLAVRNFKMYM